MRKFRDRHHCANTDGIATSHPIAHGNIRTTLYADPGACSVFGAKGYANARTHAARCTDGGANADAYPNSTPQAYVYSIRPSRD